MRQILDYSSGRPSAVAVRAAGYLGASRYLSWLPNPKVLTPAECQDYWACGLSLACVWEVNEDPRQYAPRLVGTEVDRQMRADGFPDSWGFYVAVDYDAPESDWPSLAGWGDACSSTAGRPWRLYGKKVLGEQLVADGHMPSYWCPTAWSGDGLPGMHACLFQRLGTPVVDGVDCDANDVLQDDWLGWQPTPAPAPPATSPLKDGKMRHDLTITTDAQGNGYGDMPLDFTQVEGLFVNGADPAGVGYSPIPRLAPLLVGAGTRVVLEGGPPNGQVLVHVTAAT